MLVVSSREFREKQAEYMDRLDNGEQIIIQRGKNKAYAITPVTEDDVYFSPKMIQKIKDSIQQADAGNVVKIDGVKELENFFKNL
ncbi:immunoglobulin-like domain-containing protein [Pedobacter agri]|uniref:immunoglobulin-like domain-containing protein n=1 Tax=Pedobacter agri TaxID=454586 RepID=UPI00292EB2AB|nr:immunoglobulin-like domain-containing protein [Pedobacter agri]